MSKATGRISVCLVFAVFLCCTSVSRAFAQSTPFFAAGNLVVSVEGNGVEAGTGSYGDNQAAPFTLFQFQLNASTPTSAPATYVNSLVFPQTGSGANFPVSGEYGSSSEGTLQLAGTGQYLTTMGYGVSASLFNASPATYGIPGGELGQSGSLTGQSYTAVPRVVTLIDPYGNVNSSTALYNIFNANNPRSTYTADGTHIYVSGQGTSGDATGGVFYTTLGSSSATTITGADAGSGAAQDTRAVQIYNNTLFISMDSKSGSYNRSYVGTLGSPPATSVFTCTGVGAGCPSGDGTIGPALMSGFGNTGGTGKVTITSGSNSNGNSLNNTGLAINISPENYFFASPSVLYVADSGSPKNNSNVDTVCTNDGGTGSVGNGGLQKWVNSQSNGSGTWTLAYTLYKGLGLVLNTACDPADTDGTTGLYGLTGVVNGSSVYLYATNFTIADLDPTYVYGITDTLSYTTASQASSETFTQLATAPADSNFKGIAFAPTLPAGSATITTIPSGLTVTSAGTGCAPGSYYAPVTPTWTPGSSCTLSVVSPQPGGTGTQYAFAQWQDATTGTSDTVTAPSTTAIYTATFNTQYQLTTSATTGGSVSAGGYYNSGTDAIITATPSPGYYFVNFTGATTSTSNPLTLVMSAPQSITANFAPQQSQTITFTTNAPASAAFGSSFTVAASASSGLTVAFTSSGSCTNSGAIYTMTSGTGTCSVIANQAGNSNYQAAGTVTQSVSATPVSTSIVVGVNPTNEDYGLDSTVTITAVLSYSGSGAAPTGAVTIGGTGPSGYSATSCGAPSGDTITCSASYTPTVADGAGTYTESASFAGDSNYSSSSSSAANNFTINVASTNTSVSVDNPSPTFGQTVNFTATVGGENGLFKGRTRKNGVKPLDVSGSITWSANTGCGTTPLTTGNPATAICTTSSLPTGSDPVTATYSGDSNHSVSSGSFSETVNQISQTITFTTNAPASAAYNSNFTVAATGGASGNPVTFTSAGSCSNSGATYTMTSGTGTCSVIANQAGNTNYAAATAVMQTVNGTPLSQTVSFTTNAPSTAVYNTSFTVAASASSGLAVTYTSSGSCSNSGALYTMTSGTGTCSVTATQSGNGNYSAATPVTQSVTAKPATQSITVTTPAPATEVYNGTFTVGASASSGLALTYTATGVCTNGGTSTYTMTSGGGTCTVKLSQAGNSNYTAASTVTETTAASEATQNVTFTGAPTTPVPYLGTFTVSATTNAPITPIITTNSACSINGSTVTMETGSGTCTLTATWNGNGNYQLARATQTATAEKATPIVSWGTPSAITYPTPLSPTQLDASANTAGTFTYSPKSGAILGAGSDTLSVTFKPSNTNYTSAPATVTLQVLQQPTTTAITSGNQTVTLNRNGIATSIQKFNVGGYKPSGAVSVVASTGEVCSGNVSASTGDGSCKLTFANTGSRTVTATYSGDDNHSSSTTTQTVTITVN
jgi:hypothetical protein